MNALADYVPIVSAFCSVAVPLAVIIIGFKINKSVETIKTEVAKEKDWQTFWANEYLENVRTFNLNLSSFAVCLQRMAQHEDGQSAEIKRMTFELSRTNWVISSMAFTALDCVSQAVSWNDKIVERIGNIKSSGTINMDELIIEQKSFLESSMAAHREMLRLNRRAQ